MKMKNRHLINILPRFRTSPSGYFQFSLVGRMTHGFLPWLISFSFIVQVEISRSKTDSFTDFVNILPDSYQKNKSQRNRVNGLERASFPSLGLKRSLVSF